MAAEPLIRARAPLRISFAGGGTDVPPFPEREGGAVLSATINRYAFASLRTRTDRQVTVRVARLRPLGRVRDRRAGPFDGDLDLAKAAVQRLLDRELAGFDLFLHSNAPPGSGLGSSSAMVVALVGLLQERYRLALTDYAIAEIAHQVEREDLGIRGGLQDHYAATFGGFNYIEFAGDRVVVNPLRIHPDMVNELEHNLLLVYTGRTRLSDHLIDDQIAALRRRRARLDRGPAAAEELAKDMKDALLRRQARGLRAPARRRLAGQAPTQPQDRDPVHRRDRTTWRSRTGPWGARSRVPAAAATWSSTASSTGATWSPRS